MVTTKALKGMEFIRGDRPIVEALRNERFINCKTHNEMIFQNQELFDKN